MYKIQHTLIKSLCLHYISSVEFYMDVQMCIFSAFVGDPVKYPWLLTLNRQV